MRNPTAYQEKFAPPRWPFAGEPPHNWNLTRFNPEFFRHYERRLAQLRDLGVQADLILFNPYGRWGFETMDAAADPRWQFKGEWRTDPKRPTRISAVKGAEAQVEFEGTGAIVAGPYLVKGGKLVKVGEYDMPRKPEWLGL